MILIYYQIKNQLDEISRSQYCTKSPVLKKYKERSTITEIVEEKKKSIIKKNDCKSKNENNKNISQFNFNILEYFISLFLNCGIFKKKKAIFDYSIQLLNHKIDLQSIIDKLNEIDKLKHILLNKDQLILFDYLPKPCISYIINEGKVIFEDKQGLLLKRKYKDKQRNIQTAANSFQRLQTIESGVNNRIIQYLGEKNKRIFEQKSEIDQQLILSQKTTQCNQNESNKQPTLFSKQNSMSSMTTSNCKEFFVNDQDKTDVLDKVIKQSTFALSPDFRISSLENEKNRQEYRNILIE